MKVISRPGPKEGDAAGIGRTVVARSRWGIMETRELWHPDSPGERVRVRTVAISPRQSFASLGQVVRMYGDKKSAEHRTGLVDPFARAVAELAEKGIAD